MKFARPAFAAAALVLAAGISGCASPPEPITNLDGRVCTPVLEFSAARPLGLDDKNEITVDIDQKAPCWVSKNGERSTYLLFSLPDSIDPYLLTVRSESAGQTIFAPRLLMLDGFGNVLREMPRESFQYHGASLYLGIRVHPAEKYALVASDPRVIGQAVSQVQDGTRVQTIVSSGIAVSIHTGTETTAKYVFAVNGKVTVTAKPMPKAQ